MPQLMPPQEARDSLSSSVAVLLGFSTLQDHKQRSCLVCSSMSQQLWQVNVGLYMFTCPCHFGVSDGLKFPEGFWEINHCKPSFFFYQVLYEQLAFVGINPGKSASVFSPYVYNNQRTNSYLSDGRQASGVKVKMPSSWLAPKSKHHVMENSGRLLHPCILIWGARVFISCPPLPFPIPPSAFWLLVMYKTLCTRSFKVLITQISHQHHCYFVTHKSTAYDSNSQLWTSTFYQAWPILSFKSTW